MLLLPLAALAAAFVDLVPSLWRAQAIATPILLGLWGLVLGNILREGARRGVLRRAALVIVSGLLALPSVIAVYDGNAGNGARIVDLAAEFPEHGITVYVCRKPSWFGYGSIVYTSRGTFMQRIASMDIPLSGHERHPGGVRLVFRRLAGFGRTWVADVDARTGAVRMQ
ncbi:MAG: hypothetical protein IPO88_08630 [Nannocystis sp.]|uniref:hypothetical protein n=1 Tax=Nannocystis sp. TaxID=1962667 RepID=UPI00242905A7|nr:hypothetical protein [Nannocystis sp.]MBK9753558.1 hypothetical protein [Nannocystis sp.]